VREIAIISGKGGTGKTSLVGAFVQLSRRCLAIDADVDAANLALLLPGEDGPQQSFLQGRRAVLDAVRCTACGACLDVCRFSALRRSPDAVVSDSIRCEGCGACAQVCDEKAVSFRENRAGTWQVRTTAWGTLVHARLGVAQGNSGKLVTHLRQEAARLCEASGMDLVLLDGPPGIGCAVHATITGVDLVVVVTEPTEAGSHDLTRALDLVARFGAPAGIILNKADLHPEGADLVETIAALRKVPVLGSVPFDPRLPRALAAGQTGLELEGTRGAIRACWEATMCQLPCGRDDRSVSAVCAGPCPAATADHAPEHQPPRERGGA
jgi:MinD superfamily P-loop ATPase